MSTTNARFLRLGQGFEADVATGNLIAKIAEAGGIEVTAAGFKIVDAGITDAMLAGAISTGKLADGALFIKSDGSVAMAAALAMGANKITGLADGVDAQDAVTKSQLDAVSAGTTDELVVEVASVAHGFDNDFVYHNGTSWVKASGGAATSVATHFAVADGVDAFKAVQIGEVDVTGLLDAEDGALVAGQYYFLSQTEAGKVTATEPASGVSQLIMKVNAANSASVFCHQPVVVGEASATWGDIDGTLADQTDLMNLFDAVAGGHAAFDFSALESVEDATSTLSGAIGDLDADLKALSDASGVALGVSSVTFASTNYIGAASDLKSAIDNLDSGVKIAIDALVTGASFTVKINSADRYADAAAAVDDGLGVGDRYLNSGDLKVMRITNATDGSEASVEVVTLVAGNVVPVVIDGGTSSVMKLVLGDLSVIDVNWEITEAGDELKMDSGDGRTLHVNVSYTPSNYSVTADGGSDSNVLISEHLEGIDAKLGDIIGSVALEKTTVFHTISAGEVTAGKFVLDAASDAVLASVRLFPVEGIEQFNNARGEVVTLGLPADFEVINNTGSCDIAFKDIAKSAATSISDILIEGDKLRIEYLKA